MFEDIPVEVGLVYEGERVRKDDMQVELGGPHIAEKFELVQVKSGDEVNDGAISIIGPDISTMEEGKSYPIGILVEIAGPRLERDLEGVIERRIHEYSNYIEGFMHLNQRYDVWMRLSKNLSGKGSTRSGISASCSSSYTGTTSRSSRRSRSRSSPIPKRSTRFTRKPCQFTKRGTSGHAV